MIDQIIAFNKTFVAQKGYKRTPCAKIHRGQRFFIIDSETETLEEKYETR